MIISNRLDGTVYKCLWNSCKSSPLLILFWLKPKVYRWFRFKLEPGWLQTLTSDRSVLKSGVSLGKSLPTRSANFFDIPFARNIEGTLKSLPSEPVTQAQV